MTQSRSAVEKHIRVSAEYICAIDERRPEHRRVESARDGRCHQPGAAPSAELALHTGDGVVRDWLDGCGFRQAT